RLAPALLRVAVAGPRLVPGGVVLGWSRTALPDAPVRGGLARRREGVSAAGRGERAPAHLERKTAGLWLGLDAAGLRGAWPVRLDLGGRRVAPPNRGARHPL